VVGAATARLREPKHVRTRIVLVYMLMIFNRGHT